ncbi:hypothetical protein PM082_023861 [Marasmius tenuissimus]|nr:hypothetical protein PM082_023861 [Marasmius tenuissimus]
MPITTLPYDITTQIIDILEQSAIETYSPLKRLACLNAYSLISPGPWLESARERYWSKLEVPYDQTKRFQDMLLLFSSPFSTLHLSKIRSLHYGSTWIWEGRRGYGRPEDRTPVRFLEWCGSPADEAGETTVADRYLGHLECLHFKNVYILDDSQYSAITSYDPRIRPSPLSPKAKMTLLASFKTITRLSFRSNVVFSSEEQFAEILASFPALEVSTNFHVAFQTPSSHVYQPLPASKRALLRLREFEWFLKPGDLNDNLMAVITDVFSLSTAARQSLTLQETYVAGHVTNMDDHYERHPTTSQQGFLSKLPSLFRFSIHMKLSKFEDRYLHEMLTFLEPHPTLASLEILDFSSCTKRTEIDAAIRTSLPHLESIDFSLKVVLASDNWGDIDYVRRVQYQEELAFARFSSSMPHCQEKGLLRCVYHIDNSSLDDIEVEEWDWDT